MISLPTVKVANIGMILWLNVLFLKNGVKQLNNVIHPKEIQTIIQEEIPFLKR